MANENMTTGQRFFISSAWFLAAGLMWFVVSALFWYFTVFSWKQIIGHFTILIAIIFLILYILRYIIELRNGPSPTEDTPILTQNTPSQAEKSPIIYRGGDYVGFLKMLNDLNQEDLDSLLIYDNKELEELYKAWKSGRYIKTKPIDNTNKNEREDGIR